MKSPASLHSHAMLGYVQDTHAPSRHGMVSKTTLEPLGISEE